MHGSYHVRISEELHDAQWDAFLLSVPGSHHMQSSPWAVFKSRAGWRPVRIVVEAPRVADYVTNYVTDYPTTYRRDEQQPTIQKQERKIVGGGQLLIRPLPRVGVLGHVAQLMMGPTFAVGAIGDTDADMAGAVDRFFAELFDLIRFYHIHYLVIQPPFAMHRVGDKREVVGMGDREARLQSHGFQKSATEFEMPATVLVDVTAPPDEIMARMHRKTRQYIRGGLKRGVQVRVGSKVDLPTFYRLHTMTNERQGFPLHPEDHFTELWDAFAPYDAANVFMTASSDEQERTPISAIFALAWGDTVVCKANGWTGRYTTHRPNEVLYWGVLSWAHEHGYRWCDLDGLEPAIARAVLAEEPIPDSLASSWSLFKLRFGGQAVLLYDAYEYIPNPVVRWAYQTALPHVQQMRDIILTRMGT